MLWAPQNMELLSVLYLDKVNISGSANSQSQEKTVRTKCLKQFKLWRPLKQSLRQEQRNSSITRINILQCNSTCFFELCNPGTVSALSQTHPWSWAKRSDSRAGHLSVTALTKQPGLFLSQLMVNGRKWRLEILFKVLLNRAPVDAVSVGPGAGHWGLSC